jgi:phosphoserine phosphatase RsbU/P
VAASFDVTFKSYLGGYLAAQEIAMATALLSDHSDQLRHRLVDRRARLERVVGTSEATPLRRLLQDVDAALARLDEGTYGVCDACRGAVEADRLAADPLARTCLDCLTAAEQRALERDLDLAGRVQRSLLPPRRLQHGGWDAAYEYQPLGAASGDYVDLLPLDHDELMFVVGDVSGKGVAASLLMTHLHATIRSLVALGVSFDEVPARTNRLFHGSLCGDHYVTLLFGKSGPTGEVELANAGHCPPIVVRGGEARTFPATSVPLGLFADAPFPTVRVTLQPGDSLVIYTDGLSEASDGGGLEYGRDRLVASALAHRHADVPALVTSCLADLSGFRRHDDATLFALRRVTC